MDWTCFFLLLKKVEMQWKSLMGNKELIEIVNCKCTVKEWKTPSLSFTCHFIVRIYIRLATRV